MKLINDSRRAAAFNQWQKLFIGCSPEQRGAQGKESSLGQSEGAQAGAAAWAGQQTGVSRLYSSNLDSGLLGLLIIFCLAGDDCLNYYFFSHYNYKENKRRNAKRENKMKNKQTDLIQNKLKYFNFLMLISSFW